MSEITLIPSQTAAATVTIDARAYEKVTLKCSALGAAETIAINVLTGSAVESVVDVDFASGTSAVITFTGSGGTPANAKQFSLDGDLYQIVKDVTASAVTVTAILGRKKNG